MGFENSNKNGAQTDGRLVSLTLRTRTYLGYDYELSLDVTSQRVPFTHESDAGSFEIRWRLECYGPRPAARLVYPVKVVAFAFPVAVAGLRLKACAGRIRENKYDFETFDDNDGRRRPTDDERFTNTGR